MNLPFEHSNLFAERLMVYSVASCAVLACIMLLCKQKRMEHVMLLIISPNGKVDTDFPSIILNVKLVMQ